MIGSACAALLRTQGYRVLTLTRKALDDPDSIQWAPADRWIEHNVIDGCAAVINVTGISIAGSRWTPAYKQKLQDSRTVPAAFLASLIRDAAQPPPVYIGASGVGIYGNTGPGAVREDHVSNDDGFLRRLAHDWESAHLALDRLTRVVVLRIGVVLSNEGGFMERLGPPARFGLYPVFGHGDQIMSWIHIEDLTRVFHTVMTSSSVLGPLNAVAPHALSFRAFARHYRAANTGYGLIFRIPRWVARLVFGEMSDVLLESTHASAQTLIEHGFSFKYPDARGALHALLGR